MIFSFLSSPTKERRKRLYRPVDQSCPGGACCARPSAGPRNGRPQLAALRIGSSGFFGWRPAPVFRCGRRSFRRDRCLREIGHSGFAQGYGFGALEAALRLAGWGGPCATPWVSICRNARQAIRHQVELDGFQGPEPRRAGGRRLRKIESAAGIAGIWLFQRFEMRLEVGPTSAPSFCRPALCRRGAV